MQLLSLTVDAKHPIAVITKNSPKYASMLRGLTFDEAK
jgi:hypothetical protein